jgi:hypothetical protein
MAGYKPAQLTAFFRQLHDTLAAIPGVSRVSFSLYSPMEGDNWGETVYIEGQAPPPPDSDQNQTSWLRVGEGYFDAIGTKLVQGRAITDQDSATSQRVAVVNCQKFFKDSPIGKHFDLTKIFRTVRKSSVSLRTRNTGNPRARFRPCFLSALGRDL